MKASVFKTKAEQLITAMQNDDVDTLQRMEADESFAEVLANRVVFAHLSYVGLQRQLAKAHDHDWPWMVSALRQGLASFVPSEEKAAFGEILRQARLQTLMREFRGVKIYRNRVNRLLEQLFPADTATPEHPQDGQTRKKLEKAWAEISASDSPDDLIDQLLSRFSEAQSLQICKNHKPALERIRAALPPVVRSQKLSEVGREAAKDPSVVAFMQGSKVVIDDDDNEDAPPEPKHRPSADEQAEEAKTHAEQEAHDVVDVDGIVVDSGGRRRVPWTDDETDALLAGIREFGIGRWKDILKSPFYGPRLKRRDNVQLKDKWRNIKWRASEGRTEFFRNRERFQAQTAAGTVPPATPSQHSTLPPPPQRRLYRLIEVDVEESQPAARASPAATGVKRARPETEAEPNSPPRAVTVRKRGDPLLEGIRGRR